MKTNLFRPITTPAESKQYIQDLCNNGEIYHFDDDAKDIVWNGFTPTRKELKQLDINRNKLFSILKNPFEFITY